METLPLTAIPTDTAPLNVSAEDDDADEVASAWQLTHLEFMTVPHRPTSAPVQVKRETSGDTGMVTSGPPEEGGIPEQPDDSRVLQLAASFVDLGACASLLGLAAPDADCLSLFCHRQINAAIYHQTMDLVAREESPGGGTVPWTPHFCDARSRFGP